MAGPTEPFGILRRACDRCHSQKLSCQRDGNDSNRPCKRCLRADTPCSTSLSQRNRRSRPLPSAMSTRVATPASLERLRSCQSDGGDGDVHAARDPVVEAPEPGSGPGPVNPDHFNDGTADDCLPDPRESVLPIPSAEAMDWITFAGQIRLGVVTDLTSSVSARDAGDPFFGLGGDSCRTPRPASNNSGDAVSGHPPQADGQWLQRLVEINMQLFDHANKAKTKAGDSGPAPESSGDNEASSSTIGRPAGFNSFDETIVLSFYLVRALHSLYSPESLKLDEQSPLSVSSPPNLDSGTVLIIFSCYVRVLDLLMDRLGALKSALNATSTNGSSPNGAPLHLPTLVACGCPLEGYPVLRLRMTLELVEEALEVTSALVTPIVHRIDNQSQSEQSSPMPVVSAQALSAREQAVYRIINETRAEMRRHRRIMVI